MIPGLRRGFLVSSFGFDVRVGVTSYSRRILLLLLVLTFIRLECETHESLMKMSGQ